jgi:hypothetical protein
MPDTRSTLPERYAPIHRAFVKTYPFFAAFGVLCAVVTLVTEHGRHKLLALVWVVAVPVLLRQWWLQRQGRS